MISEQHRISDDSAESPVISAQSAIEKIFSLRRFDIRLRLDSIRKFLDFLGNPQSRLRTFHIAGSNGKGSTSAFIASILNEAHFSAGLYSSPHFVRFHERIKIDGKEIDEDFIASFMKQYETLMHQNNLTFFEVATALAFEYYSKKAVDFVVLETGLGGRLDATNVVSPLAVIITSISLEHTNILGSTIKEIASEKAAIIKPGSKVFLGRMPKEAVSVFEAAADSLDCELFRIEDFILEKDHGLELRIDDFVIKDIQPPLIGEYQLYNAALAALAVSKTLDLKDPHIIRSGIARVVENTGLQGRFEIANRNPLIILDSAHNHESCAHFLREFDNYTKKFKKRYALFTALNDKSIPLMFSEMKGVFDEVFLTELQNVRASSLIQLQEMAVSAGLVTKTVENLNEFFSSDIFFSEDVCFAVFGSMYLVGEVKAFLSSKLK